MKFHEFLADQGQVIVKDKNDHLFMQGEQDNALYYIKEGLLKAYYVSEDGKEFIKSFLLPENTITNLTSSHLKEPCSFSVVCLMPSTLIKVDFKTLYQTGLMDQSIAGTIIDMLLKLALKKERREYEFLCLPVEKRYRLMQENMPELLQKVTQNDVARYLGITPVALSRIKNRLQA